MRRKLLAGFVLLGPVMVLGVLNFLLIPDSTSSWYGVWIAASTGVMCCVGVVSGIATSFILRAGD